jgi:3-oxoacyl-[acyl-carrier protein] reductase
MIDMGLTGARAVVVGAGFMQERAGHGRGSALRLAEAGAAVACVDMDAGRADEIVAEIEAAGGTAVPIVGDVRSSAEANRVIDEAAEALGGLDVCVDIVGQAVFGYSDSYTDEQWDEQIQKNLTQVFYVVRAAVNKMVAQGTGGSIVTLASVDGIGASTYHTAYGAAKAGVISMMKSFSDEFGRHGIRFNAVAPGNVGGNAWGAPDVAWGADPANSLAPPRPMDIANAVLFLASSLAERVTGQTISVDGGAMTRSPWGLNETTVLGYLGGAMPEVGGR